MDEIIFISKGKKLIKSKYTTTIIFIAPTLILTLQQTPNQKFDFNNLLLSKVSETIDVLMSDMGHTFIRLLTYKTLKVILYLYVNCLIHYNRVIVILVSVVRSLRNVILLQGFPFANSMLRKKQKQNPAQIDDELIDS